MVEYGQYPLILQKDTVNGQLVPVGLAEASSLTFQSLSATTISATSYANLPSFGGNFTGIQNVCSVGVCGTSIIDSVVAGNTLNLRGFYFNLGDFLTVTPGTDVTISYDQPLAAIRGGTGIGGGNTGEIPYWDPGNSLTADPNLSYDGGFLYAPKVDTPGGGGYYVDGQPFDLGDLNSVDLTIPPTDNQLLSYDTGTGKWVARDESALASIPVDPCCIIFNDAAGNPSTDPGDLTYHGTTIRFPTGIASNSMTAQSFIENGVALSTKYQVADVTLCALGDLTILPNTVLYFDGSQNPQVSQITTQALDLLNDGSFGAMRNTLGLGTVATKSVIVLDSADVCNTLPVTKGGTGITSFGTTDGIVYYDGASLAQISQPTGSDKSLKWDGAAFTWAVIPTGTFVSPTDPCAIVFVNNDGDDITSDPDLTYNTTNNELAVGNLNSAGYILAGGNIATVGGYVAGAQVYGTTIYEGVTPISNLYQGKDPTLTTLASMNTAADVLLYFSAADGAASTTFTNQARQLLDDNSFATMRTTLELGTVATKSVIVLDSADVCNTLPVTKGGTGRATLSPCAVLFGNGTGTVSEITAPVTNNRYLKWNNGFSWATAPEQWTHVFKATTQAVADGVNLQEDSDLTIPTTIGQNYRIKYYIMFENLGVADSSLSANININGDYDSFYSTFKYVSPGNTGTVYSSNKSADNFRYTAPMATTGVGSFELDCIIENISVTSVPITYSLEDNSGNILSILLGSDVKYTTF